MKLFKKFTIGISVIFMFLQIFSLKSYAKGRTITISNAFSYSVGSMIGDYVSQNDTWTQDGWNGCIEHRGAGYSSRIIAVYETVWDSKSGKIVANSANASGTIKNSDSQYIRNLAAAMHVNKNINGVRNALRRAIKDANSNLASCSQVQGSKGQNDGETWDSDDWQKENEDLRRKYYNYQTLKADSNYKTGKAIRVNIDGTEYYKMGPFKMSFGTAKINNVEINGTPVMGKGIATYGKTNTDRKKTINETVGTSDYKMFFSDQKYYVYVEANKLKSMIGGATKVTIKFEQKDFSYKKARAIVCDDTGSTQSSLWYTNKTDTAIGGTAEFTVQLTDSIDVIVNKVWDDNNSASRPSSVKVKLSANGAVINAAGKTSLTKTITSSGTVTFSDLKRKDDDGNLLEYIVEEVVPDGYTASYTARSLTIKEGKDVYRTTITNKKDDDDTPVDPGAGDLLVTKEGGNMSFSVWEDSSPQWIKKSSDKTYGAGRSVPSDKLTGASDSDKELIDAGTKLGSYEYTHYTVYKTETRYETQSPNTEYTYYSYYSTTENVECVHVETHDWLGSYQTVNGKYKITGLYPGTYEVYETDCDQYYDVEIQDGYSETGYHDVSNIRLASVVSIAENTSETVKLGLPSSTTVHNDRTRGDLEIEKTYETGEPIDGVKIAIYGEVNDGGYNYSGWLTTDGSYESVKWNSIGDIFKGSPSNPYETEDGKVVITGLPVGTYSIYEIKTKSIEYALEEQGSFDGEKTLLGTVTITRNQDSAIQVSYAQKKRPKGDITIDKTGIYVNNQLSSPNVTGKLANVSFILSSKVTDKGGWKNGDYVYIRANEKGEDIVDFTNEKSEATVFTTDSEGKVTISGLYEDLGPYQIEEIVNNEQDRYYTDPIVTKGDTTANVSSTASIINLRSSGDLRIEKVDENYHDLKLSGGRFKLKLISSEYAGVSNMWIGDTGFNHISEGNTYNYYDSEYQEYLVSDVSNAMEFETDSNGEINIKKIINGTYEVYETKTPRGYDITKQDGYDSNTGMAYRGKVTISTNDNIVNYQVVNKKVVNKLDGIVWVDERDSKLNTYNSLYKDNSDEKDYVKEGIQVNLIDKNTGKTMASTVTDKNGHYEFTRYSDGSYIIYWDLAHSYVEYIYNNKIIYDENGEAKEYGFIVVDPFVGGQDKISINSKAQPKEITKDERFDDNLTGTENPYPGRAVTYTSEDELGFNEILKQNEEVTPNDGSKNTDILLEDKLITSYYDEDRFVIENVNLGLIEKNPTTHAIDESIEYVKIVKGNYTFKYKYGKDAITEEGYEQSAPTVKFQNSSKTFTQNIYPSDIKYNLANESTNPEDKFRVYVVYKIDIQNTTSINDENLYVEKGLYLTQLVNTYDSSRFQISSDILPNADEEEKNISNDFSFWNDADDNENTSSNDKIASFNITNSNKAYKPGNGGIQPNQTESTYIQYKVTDNALNQLLSKGDLEHAPTVSTSYGYHIYERKDKNWQNKDTYTHRTIQEERTDSALYLKWHLLDPRTISGTVFEDQKDNSRENERVGNGKYDDNESKLTNVVVSLIDRTTGSIASLYNGNLSQDQTTGKWKSDKQPATITVDDNGEYNLEGVVPGEYYLQFTYGDGKVNFTDVNGNPIEKVATTRVGESSPLNSNYYKSTIITGAAKNATEENASTWFLESIQEGVNSVASDYTGTYYDANGNVVGEENTKIIEARTGSDEELNYTTSQNKVVINARTPLMNVQFENIADNNASHNTNIPEKCSGMSFGIIERPHVDIQLKKEIKNVKLTLPNGTVIVNGDPNKQDVSSNLAKINEAYAKIEVASDYLYGSNLTITYNLIATNESEVDYATSDYYKYGNKSDDDLVTTTITKIVDYLSYSGCTYNDQDKKNIDKISDEGQDNCDTKTYFAPNIEEKNSKYGKKYLLTSEKELKPAKADNSDGKNESKIEYTTTVSRLIGDSDDDAGVDNVSEIIGIKNLTFSPQYHSKSGNYEIGNEDTNEDDNTNATIVITPPTGENRSYTMYIVAGISLIVIAGGVILIKKFVL